MQIKSWNCSRKSSKNANPKEFQHNFSISGFLRYSGKVTEYDVVRKSYLCMEKCLIIKFQQLPVFILWALRWNICI